MNMSLRKAEYSDMQNLLIHYDKVMDYMDENKIDEWDEIYPREELIFQYVQNKNMYIFEDEGKICGSFALVKGVEEKRVGLFSKKRTNVGLIYVYCQSPEFCNAKKFDDFFDEVEKTAKEEGCEKIMIDVLSLNGPAVKSIQKRNFKKVGEQKQRKGTFYVMEKEF